MIYADVAQALSDLQRDLQSVCDLLEELAAAVAPEHKQSVETICKELKQLANDTIPAEQKAQLQFVQQPQILLQSARSLFDNQRTALLGWSNRIGQLGQVLPNKFTGVTNRAGTILERIVGRLLLKLAYYGQLQSDEGTNASLDGIRDSVQDVTTYPVLTREIGPWTSGGYAGGGGSSSTTSIGTTVDNALRQVLAWRSKGAEAGALKAKGFVAALDQSFSCEDVEGRMTCTWTPRSYVVQADLGAVTGAQASLYSRAKVALDHALPILDGLGTLRPDADDEDVSASRSVTRTYVVELVNELGESGGPRVQRVDALFESLLGDKSFSRSEDVGGLLGNVREEFGLSTAEVTTVDEEKTLTDFLILVDHVTSLQSSWVDRRRYFTRDGKNVYLGTELILLNRALAVTGESVHELRAAMDSVFLSEAERATTSLNFSALGQSPLYVSELLSWIEKFAGETGPRLIDDGGRAGVAALFPVIDRLVELCSAARTTVYEGGFQDPTLLPGGYATARVQNSLGELLVQLSEVQGIAVRIRDAE